MVSMTSKIPSVPYQTRSRSKHVLNLTDFILNDCLGYGSPLHATHKLHYFSELTPKRSTSWYRLGSVLLHGLIAGGDIEPNPGPDYPCNHVHNFHDRQHQKNIISILSNTRGIRNKGHQLQLYLHANPLPDLLFFTETWLTPHDNDSILGLPADCINPSSRPLSRMPWWWRTCCCQCVTVTM